MMWSEHGRLVARSDGGTWIIPNDRHDVIRFTSNMDETTEEWALSELYYRAYDLEVWIQKAGATVLMTCNESTEVLRLIPEMSSPVAVATLSSRISLNVGLRHCTFRTTHAGPCLIYESGVVAFDGCGVRRWHVDHGKLDFLFDGIDEEIVLYRNERLGRWGYALSDGRRVDLE